MANRNNDYWELKLLAPAALVAILEPVTTASSEKAEANPPNIQSQGKEHVEEVPKKKRKLEDKIWNIRSLEDKKSENVIVSTE